MSALRADIQTLRAVAVLFVLLFHMWPSRFRFGYLGVDMFFVISGYLIFMILSQRQPIDLRKSADFYFRRVKRILPIYLFIIALSLLAILRLISSIEFPQIVREAVPALGLYSNFPNIRQAEYFDVSSRFYFFLHTWSLSVEMQFYLLVPALFFLLGSMKECNTVVRALPIAWIPLLSFAYQFLVHGDAAYMLLPARVWQFFVGFAAYYAHEMELLNFSSTTMANDKKGPQKTPIHSLLDPLFGLVVFALLYASFIYGLNAYPLVNRLLIILLTFLIVGRRNEDSHLFKVPALVKLGDVSYSVYLVHWPLFTWHRYSTINEYADGNEVDIFTGLTLIIVALVLGFSIETLFKSLLKWVNTWSVLALVLFAGYALNAALLYALTMKGVDLNNLEFDMTIPDADRLQRREEMMQLWERRHSPANLSADEVMSTNARLGVLYFCDNHDPELPTRSGMNMRSYYRYGYVCHDRIGEKVRSEDKTRSQLSHAFTE